MQIFIKSLIITTKYLSVTFHRECSIHSSGTTFRHPLSWQNGGGRRGRERSRKGEEGESSTAKGCGPVPWVQPTVLL